MDTLILNGHDLTLQDVYDVAYDGRKVETVEIESNQEWSTAAHRRSDDDHFEFGLVE